MLNYLNSASLGAYGPTVMFSGQVTLLAGLGQVIGGGSFVGMPQPTYLEFTVSNPEAALSGNNVILTFDCSPNHLAGIIVFPQSTERLDLRGVDSANGNLQAINGEAWPLGGLSMPYLHNPNANPVRVQYAFTAVM